MKLKCKFVINNVAGEDIAVPVGKEGVFRGYIRLNKSGKEIFEILKNDTDREKVLNEMMKKYPDAPKEEIAESVDDIIGKLTEAGLLI